MINKLLELNMIQYDNLPSSDNNMYYFYDGRSIVLNTTNEFDLNQFIISKLDSLPEKNNNINSEDHICINSKNYIYMLHKNQIIFLVGMFENKMGCIFNNQDAFKIKLVDNKC